MSLVIRQLTPDDIPLMEALSATFGEAFDNLEAYHPASSKCGLAAATARH